MNFFKADQRTEMFKAFMTYMCLRRWLMLVTTSKTCLKNVPALAAAKLRKAQRGFLKNLLQSSINIETEREHNTPKPAPVLFTLCIWSTVHFKADNKLMY